MRGSALVSRTSNADRRYWGLNQIAVELENPFGDDPNDLPFTDLLCTAYPRNPPPASALAAETCSFRSVDE